MQTLTLYLPDSLDMTPKEVTMLLATRLYEQGKLSLGQAAEMAGYSKRTFMELLGDYGVSVFNYPPEELEQDVQNAARYHS
jgi:predicted HTH domain antitoxin